MAGGLPLTMDMLPCLLGFILGPLSFGILQGCFMVGALLSTCMLVEDGQQQASTAACLWCGVMPHLVLYAVDGWFGHTAC